MMTLASLKARARQVKIDLIALSLAARDPRTPWYARAVVAAVAAYALSPIDLIPDFIPVRGLLDDAVLVPRGRAEAFVAAARASGGNDGAPLALRVAAPRAPFHFARVTLRASAVTHGA